MLSLLALKNTVRVPENNDWVVFVMLISIAIFLFVIISLQRDSTIKDYLLQKYDEASNVFPSWILVSFAFCLCLSALISQYVPFVPRFISEREFLGFQINKFGFVFLSLIMFYGLKSVFSYFFFQSIGYGKSWKVLYFVSTKFYFVVSLLLIILSFINYYLPVKQEVVFPIYFWFLVIAFIFKVFYYLFNKSEIFEFRWYYKFLYICTLQIAPFFALWKLLFI